MPCLQPAEGRAVCACTWLQAPGARTQMGPPSLPVSQLQYEPDGQVPWPAHDR